MTTEGSALWFRAVTYSPVPHVQVQVANWLTEDKVRMTTSNCSSRFPGARIYMAVPLHVPAKTHMMEAHMYIDIHKVYKYTLSM